MNLLLDKIKLIFISKDTEIDNLKAQIKSLENRNQLLDMVIVTKDRECSIWKKQVEDLSKELEEIAEEVKYTNNLVGYYKSEYQNLKGSQR